jgi:amino acid transporter
MAVATNPVPADETSAVGGGREPELKRTLGSFQVFAVSFAFISVAVGIFGTYDQVLRTGGPLGIWLWPIVAFGQGLVALVIAQFAARIALTGSSYQWASRLANPKIGWGVRLADLLLAWTTGRSGSGSAQARAQQAEIAQLLQASGRG